MSSQPVSTSADTLASSASQFSTYSSQNTLHDTKSTQHLNGLFKGYSGGDSHDKHIQRHETKNIWIPSQDLERSRTLVLCFDGTGDQFDSDNSNVVQLVSMLKKDDTSKQIVYYQAGIGTHADPILAVPALDTLSMALDEMFATNLSSHIKAGYAFLMQNYTYGDKICVFGFSRGAYTARALAGMLQKVGLLSPHNYQQIPYAYDMYKREDPEGLELSQTFKLTFCRDVCVDFLGVWDTVASVGIIPRYLPFIAENNGIKYLRHALALDERRIKFLPNYCVDPRKKGEDQNLSKKSSLEKHYEQLINEREENVTDVQEVWFAGVHADVGGGSVKNDTIHALSRIPLRWMIRECFRCNTDLIFDAAMLQQLGLNVYLDSETGKAVLGHPPKRLPSEQKERYKENQSQTLWTRCLLFLQGLWLILTFPFLRFAAFARNTSRHPARHMHIRHNKRQVLPARHDAKSHNLLLHDPVSASKHEAEEERRDALSDLYDQLEASWQWHILEWIPQRVKKQKAISRGWEKGGYHWVQNKGQGRKIVKDEMDEGLKVHRSVKTRLEAGEAFSGGRYIPKVRPHLPSRATAPGDSKEVSEEPVMLAYEEWNVEHPVHWEWVD